MAEEPTSLTESVVWPLGQVVEDARSEPMPDRLDDLDGKVIAELWDWMYDGDRAFPIIRAELLRRYPSVTFVDYSVFGDIHGANEHEVIEALPDLLRAHGCDAVIAGIGHCGTCTPAVIRASLAVERAGFPSVSVIGELYEEHATVIANYLGFEDPPLAVYPGHIKTDTEVEFEEKFRTSVCDQIVASLTNAAPTIVTRIEEPKPRGVVFTGTVDEILDHFDAEGWSDGLPIVPPTIERVERFLRSTPRDPEEVVGVMLPARREVTVWSVAANGVMAGCRPEYMPVLLAVAEGIADPAFKAEDAGSGTGWEPLVIVSGPIIDELGFNFGTGAMRLGRRANTSIGRFTKLLLRNFGGMQIPPGKTDKTGVGTSFYVVLAEDEASARAIGWPTFGEELGLSAHESAATVVSVIAASPPLFYGRLPHDDVFTYLEPLVQVFGQAILGYWCFTGLKWASWHPTIVLSPRIAAMVAEMGWSKDDLRRYLYEQALVPAGDLERRGQNVQLDIAEQVAAGLISPDYLRSRDPNRLVSAFVRPEWIQILVAGNPDGPIQQGYMNNHAQGIPITRRVGSASPPRPD